MSEILNLADVKSYLGIGYTDEDGMLQDLLDEAEARVADYINSVFVASPTTYVEKLTPDAEYLFPTTLPIVAISKVEEWRTSNEFTGAYSHDGVKIFRDDGGIWTRGELRWEVTYTAGYTAATIPTGLKLAIRQIMTRIYQVRDGRKGENAAGHTINWAAIMESDLWDNLVQYRLGGFAG